MAKVSIIHKELSNKNFSFLTFKDEKYLKKNKFIIMYNLKSPFLLNFNVNKTQ